MNTYKDDLDRIAQAIYPHKSGERFAYSVDFMIQEIDKMRAELKIANYNYGILYQNYQEHLKLCGTRYSK